MLFRSMRKFELVGLRLSAGTNLPTSKLKLLTQTVPSSCYFPGQMFNLGDDEFVHRHLHRVGRARHGHDHAATIGASGGAREHGGCAYLSETEHAKEFAKPRHVLFELAADDIECGIARGDAGAAGEQH